MCAAEFGGGTSSAPLLFPFTPLVLPALLSSSDICSSTRAYLIHTAQLGPVTINSTYSGTAQCNSNELLTQGEIASSANDQRFKPFTNHPQNGVAWLFEARYALLGAKTPPVATFYALCVGFR